MPFTVYTFGAVPRASRNQNVLSQLQFCDVKTHEISLRTVKVPLQCLQGLELAVSDEGF